MRIYPGISIVTLGVADVRRASLFYQRLGWRMSVAASNAAISFFTLNAIVLALFGREALAADSGLPAIRGDASPGAFSGVTLAQNHPSEIAVRQAMDDALSAGASELVPPSATSWGGYHAVFADPDGHVWELAYNPFFALSADGGVELPD
ncbi:MAG: VOC family protein [Beijerinckiaceae bacterium]